MTIPWSADELARIAKSDELEIAGTRADGTHRPWVPIWVVSVGDQVYVRTWYRRDNGWFGQVLDSGRARIRVPGLEVAVAVEDVGAAGPEIRAGVDAAYRAKYERYGAATVDRMLTDDAAATTLRLVAAEGASLDGFTAGYIEVDGHRVWREWAGAGPAVMLLHGAFSGASAWAGQASTLVKAGFTVHVPERRGHAHTPDVDGPLTYSVMAEDTVAYLEQEVHGPAHLVGWSDGAVVALLVALRRPDLVGRLVLIGQYYNSSGKVPGSVLLDMIGRPEAMSFLRTEHDRFSPDGPEHFAVVYAKTVAMISSEPELDLHDLATFSGETIVLQGDRDEVTLEHSAAVAAALGNGRLAVLPGTHGLPVEQPGPVNALLCTFLWKGFPRGLFDAF